MLVIFFKAFKNHPFCWKIFVSSYGLSKFLKWSAGRHFSPNHFILSRYFSGNWTTFPAHVVFAEKRPQDHQVAIVGVYVIIELLFWPLFLGLLWTAINQGFHRELNSEKIAILRDANYFYTIRVKTLRLFI